MFFQYAMLIISHKIQVKVLTVCLEKDVVSNVSVKQVRELDIEDVLARGNFVTNERTAIKVDRTCCCFGKMPINITPTLSNRIPLGVDV